MTYNTGNPIGSTDARDRSDNSENLDLAVNSLAQTFVDRLGMTRDTLEGIYQKSAYYRAGTFDAGYTLTNNRQTLAYGNVEYSWSGAFPKVVTAGATPATSGGIGAGAWVDRSGDLLRQELASNYGTSLIGTFPTMAALKLVTGTATGKRAYIREYNVGTSLGSGWFTWDAASTVADDGGVVIQVTGVATGRWVREVGGFVTPTMFGAIGGSGNSANDTIAHQKALAYAIANKKVLRLAPGEYYLTAALTYSGTNPVVIAGPGRSLCNLYFTGNINGLSITTTSITDIGNFSIMSPDIKTSGVAVSVTNSGQVKLNNLYIARTGGSNTWYGGISFNNCNYTVTDNCFITSTANAGVYGIAWEGTASSVSHDVINTMMYSVDIAYYAHTTAAATSGVEGIRISGGEAVCNTGFMFLSDANTAVYVPPLYMLSNTHINVATRLGRIKNTTEIVLNNCIVYNSNTTGEAWIDNQGCGTLAISGGEYMSTVASSNSASFHYAGVSACESLIFSNVLIKLPTTGSKLSTATTEGFLKDVQVIGVRLNAGGSWYSTGDIWFSGDMPTDLVFANNTPLCTADLTAATVITANAVILTGIRAPLVTLAGGGTVTSITTGAKNPTKEVTVVCNVTGTIFQHNSALLLKGSINATTATAGDSITFKYLGGSVYREISRTF